ncbi:MAG: sugar phosphate isomerase/epimerase [Firmicutes bacterium]|nr:sugar phosphate isomerase/epimerase [Bacillota bacterium]
MKHSIFTVTMKSFSVDEAIKSLSSAGFDGVEWRVHEEYHLSLDLLAKQAEQIGRRCRDSGLEVVSLATYLKIDDEERIESVAEAAARMGSPCFRVWLPSYERGAHYRELYVHSLENLATIEEQLAGFPVRALVEIHMDTIAPSSSLITRLVEDLDPKRIGVIFDPGNMVYEGRINWRLSLEILGEYLSHVHVKNAAWKRDDNGRWRCGSETLWDGQVDWREVISDLKAVGYDGYLSLEDFSELPEHEKIVKDLAYLKKVEEDEAS